MSLVRFTLNGEEVSVGVDEAAGKTLNEYIRHNSGFTGTKVSCAQGGCGACTVAVARPSQPKPKSIASCITPLAAMHGAAIITVEGLSKDDTPHPVAERLAKFNGTQCGFCTPGMVMQLYSTLNSQDGGKVVKESDLEQCINGNVCRCTGYRPIIECAKSFASDTTVKNWIDPSCAVGPYDSACDPAVTFPSEAPCTGNRWLRPVNIQGAFDAIANGATPIAGGTAAGVYPELSVVGTEKTFVDISHVEELKSVEVQSGCVEIGSAVTWNEFAQTLTDLVAGKDVLNKEALEELRDRCSSIAGAQVRNAGTIGGNIAITRNKGFLSDWVPPLVALGAKVKLMKLGGQCAAVDLLDFVQEKDTFIGLIVGVTLPLPAKELRFKSFRVAKRSRNAHALVNAAFVATSSGDSVTDVKIVLGAVDPKPLRLQNLEKALTGVTAKAVQDNPSLVVAGLCEKVRSDLLPLNCNFGRDQTDHIVSGFAVKFIAKLFEQSVPKEWQSASYCLHDMPRHSSSKQTFPLPTDLGGDLHKPVAKTTALDQTMGSSKFTDDEARPAGTLMSALVLCPEANVHVTHIAIESARALLGDLFHSLITSTDLRKTEIDAMGFVGMKMGPEYNDAKKQVNHQYLLPLNSPSQFAGQPVAMLLAYGDQPRLVERAAVELSKGLTLVRQGPVNIGDLRESPEVTPSMILTKGKPGVAQKLIAQAKSGQGREKYVTGHFAKKSQSHFYLEGQSLLVVPNEGGMTVHVSAQTTSMVQEFVADATGIQHSRVSVKCRRVGGGFGGKMTAAIMLSALSAQVAQKVKKPVRLVLPRETDMQIVGGRQEMDGTWHAAVDPSTGKILAVEYEIWFAHGAFQDMQKMTPGGVGGNMDMVYSIPNYHYTARLVNQHVPNRTAVRAPGHFESVLVAEAVMDGVSSELGMPGHTVREANFFRGSRNTSGLKGGGGMQGCLDGYSHLTMWQQMKAKTNHETRAKEVQAFNQQNKWKKRGVAITPARYGMMVMPGHSARMDIFKDGSIQIAVSGMEIGQGLHTKVGQAVTTALARGLGGIAPPLTAIRFLESSSEATPKGGITGGSSTSEVCMYASILCAEQLIAKLKPGMKAVKTLKDEKKSTHPTHSAWYDLVEGLFSLKFNGMVPLPQNLTAQAVHQPSISTMKYETYGLAATEIELDVLTGETRVLKSQLMFDIGKSFNPMVDVGQVEGSFIMGMGQHMNETVEFDKSTGKLLTDNTWTYKPPIACDVPETFNVDLVDMSAHRVDPCCFMGLVKCMSGIMSCLNVPWKVSQPGVVYRSAKAVGEPPLLLAASVQSAHHAAIVAARGTVLKDNYLPIPAKPFDILPLLSPVRPGGHDASSETASTATPQSAI